MREVSDYLGYLLDLLRKEIEYQEQVLSIAREKKKLLLENHLQDLVQCLRQEETLILQAQDLEEEMAQVWKKMCGEHALNRSEFCLSELIDIAQDEQAAELREVKEQLTAIVQDLEQTNQQNALLIREALEYVNIVFSLLIDGPPEAGPDPRYASHYQKGSANRQVSGMLVDGTV